MNAEMMKEEIAQVSDKSLPTKLWTPDRIDLATSKERTWHDGVVTRVARFADPNKSPYEPPKEWMPTHPEIRLALNTPKKRANILKYDVE